MSKSLRIESKVELREAVRKYFADDPTLQWHWSEPKQSRDGGADGYADLTIDGQRVHFFIQCKLTPTVRDIEKLAAVNEPRTPLLVAPRLSESLAEQCRVHGISCIDLNGRTWLRNKGILVERFPRADRRFRPALPTPDLFSPKSSRLPRALLNYPNDPWTRSELAQQTGLSPGLISRLVRHLIDEGILEYRNGEIVLKRRDTLLDAWAAADKWSKRTIVRQYSTLESDVNEIAYKLRTAFPQGFQLLFTQWFAAKLRHPYTVSPIVSAYVSDFDDAQIERALNARRVDEGGTLWLILPNDEGVFRETQSAGGFTIASDAQIYLDLLQVGLRGPDQAKSLREWEGFGKHE